MSWLDSGSSISASMSVLVPSAVTVEEEEVDDEYSQLPLFLNAKKKKLLLEGAANHLLIHSLTNLLTHLRIAEERQKELKASEFNRKKSIKSSISIAGLAENMSKRVMNYMDVSASSLCRVPMSKNIAIADKACDNIKFVNYNEWYLSHYLLTHALTHSRT